MTLLIIAIYILFGGGLLALALNRFPALCSRIGSLSVVAGGLTGLRGLCQVMVHHRYGSIQIHWPIPSGSVQLALDPISLFFLIPTLLLSTLAAVYGHRYLAGWQGKKALGASWFFFNMLVISMMLVLLARNALVFLVAWELMTLSSFLLVAFEHEHSETRKACWLYIAATHIGTAFLIAFFILLGKKCGSLDFQDFHQAATAIDPRLAGVLFLLALIGFGTKAGLMPMHIWLPEAHPAAPSHVSALMSGVMIKTGIYGLVRGLTFIGAPPVWWGWLLIAAGLVSGILGVLFAIAQHDLKRLLAYHSVENIGIIVMGLGLGLLGQSLHNTPLMILGFAGGLLHVFNHALFKGLLFLTAGAVLHACKTREIDHLGGLLKRMPWTGISFLIGAAAISGLPPFNGFVSEFLIYYGALRGAITNHAGMVIPFLTVIAGLALIGGLAVACFVKAFGIIFLGEPRSPHAQSASEVGFSMKGPFFLLATLCLLFGLAPAAGFYLVAPAASQLVGTSADATISSLMDASSVLSNIATASGFFVVLLLLVMATRFLLGRAKPMEQTVTWDCGYAQPTPRMQYTASSFAQPLTYLFRSLLRIHHRFSPPSGLFPSCSSFRTESTDVVQEKIYRPLVTLAGAWLPRLRRIQEGRVQLYVLYVAITLLALLVWGQ